MPSGALRAASSQLPSGTRNASAPLASAAEIFCVMPPIGPTVPSVLISPVPATYLPAGERAGLELVEQPEGEHEPGAGPADVAQR
jgi:hypothetical protein